MVRDPVDVAVVGAGLMGTASAWSAARRGLSVTVLEQFSLGHAHGSSHGSARIVRRAYADAFYTRLTGPAFELWHQLEDEADAPLLRLLGGLDHGTPARIEAVVAGLTEAAAPHELIDATDAEARWPGMRFAGPVVYHPQAGTLDAAAAVRAFVAEAQRHGAMVQESAAVTGISLSGDRATLVLDDGSTLNARCVVVAAGAWTSALLAGLIALPTLTVTRQDIIHFARRDPSRPPWPSVIHQGATEIYHLAGGRDGGPDDARKVGRHDRRRPSSPSTVEERVDPRSRAELVAYVEAWLPGLLPTPQDESTCLYTTTLNEDFVLDRVGPIVVCSPCSGHGAKFAPLIGELVTSLVTRDSPVPDRFRLGAHATAVAARVSL